MLAGSYIQNRNINVSRVTIKNIAEGRYCKVCGAEMDGAIERSCKHNRCSQYRGYLYHTKCGICGEKHIHCAC
ncbi:MAG: hypothetical protein HQK93_02695 [Nitrospirae bacterium]|nr:hypothetical protein [Nitrospirota bacterium]